MDSPLHTLRTALEAWRRDEARERVYRWRRSRDASPPAEVASRHAWIASPSARDALGEAVDLGLVTELERGALAAHLARAAAEAELADARWAIRGAVRARRSVGEAAQSPLEGLAELCAPAPRGEGAARVLEGLAEQTLGMLAEARARADEAGVDRLRGVTSIPDGGPGAEVLRGWAERLLQRTDDACGEVLSTRVGEGARWDALARSLRAPDLDALVPRRDRWRRVAAGIGGLGFERELSERVRVDRSHGGLDPRARIAAVGVPLDVRVAGSPTELGVASELAAADAAGRALALCLAAPGLPVELRRPAVGSVGRAFGTLLAQLVADPVCLHRQRGLSRPDVERLSRSAGAVLLLEIRGHAAAVLARSAGGSPAERAEVGAEALRRALGVEVPPPLAALWVATPAAVGPRLRGRIAGLCAANALRERFDEDWFRNPRADEPLRAGAAQGGAIAAESWCDRELGAPADAVASACERLIELTA